MHELCTKAITQDGTQRHRNEGTKLERRNGIKRKGTGLNSLEQEGTRREQTLTLLIEARIPASRQLDSMV